MEPRSNRDQERQLGQGDHPPSSSTSHHGEYRKGIRLSCPIHEKMDLGLSPEDGTEPADGSPSWWQFFPGWECEKNGVVYYESIKRKPKTKYIWGCRCYERLQPNTKEFTLLGYTELVLELEHLKIETRLITELFPNVMGECEKINLIN